MSLSNLAEGLYIPGNQRFPAEKITEVSSIWQEVLKVSEAGSMQFVNRVILDFEKKAPEKSSNKVKDRPAH